MKRVIVALMAALAVFVGVFAGPNSGTAQAAPYPPPPNYVNNSGFSNQNLLVCGSGDCIPLEVGHSAYEGTYWSPDSVAVCAYCVAQYRAIAPGGYTTGWVTKNGGRYPGSWIDTAALFRMWGQGTQVQVIMAGPFY